MRIGAMVVVFSLAVSLPAFADPDSAAPASAPTASAQAEPSAPMAQAQAAPVATTAPVAQAANTTNLDEIVCRSSPPPTGSRLGGGRECHTVRQWNEREREDQRMVQQQQSVGVALSK